GSALEQVARLADAQAAYQDLLEDYPGSSRSREATLRLANLLARAGTGTNVVDLLKGLVAKDDPAALLLTARAYQPSDPTRALAAFRRLYFYAPTSSEAAVAATEIPRLGSTLSAANADEAMARANKFYESKRFLDATQGYSDAFARFPEAATSNAQLR